MLGFWLTRSLRVTCYQRKSRSSIVWWFSYLKVLIFVWRTSDGGFINREQAVRVSALKQSRGLSRRSREGLCFSISVNVLLQFHPSAVCDRFLKRFLLTSGPFTPCPNMHLESSGYDLFISTYGFMSFWTCEFKGIIQLFGKYTRAETISCFTKT